jgi:Mg/Co/Ni transporter MgtE
VVAEMERANFTADFFGKATPEQQFEMLAKSPEVVAAVMGRADAATLARIFKSMDAQGRVEFFARAPKATQEAICKSMGVTSERFANLSMDEKAAKLAKAPDMDLAAMVKSVDLQGKTDFFARADFAGKNDFVKLLDRNDRIAVMERAPAKVTEAFERAYSNFEKSARTQE